MAIKEMQDWQNRMERIWAFYVFEKRSLMANKVDSTGLYLEINPHILPLNWSFKDWWLGFRYETYWHVMFTARLMSSAIVISGDGDTTWNKACDSYERHSNCFTQPAILMADQMRRLEKVALKMGSGIALGCRVFALATFRSESNLISDPNFCEFNFLPIVLPAGLDPEKAILRKF